MLIEWKSSYNTNIPVIDGQHKNLVDLINKLEKKQGDEIHHDFIYEVFAKLVEYTKVHFIYEEKMLIQKKYPNFLHHKAEHEIFIKKIAEYLKDSRKEGFEVNEEIRKFLNHWFISHILKNDIDYAKHLGTYSKK